LDSQEFIAIRLAYTRPSSKQQTLLLLNNGQKHLTLDFGGARLENLPAKRQLLSRAPQIAKMPTGLSQQQAPMDIFCPYFNVKTPEVPGQTPIPADVP
jgi:hypothetical protein